MKWPWAKSGWPADLLGQRAEMTTDPPPVPRPTTESDEILTADTPAYQPPADAQRTDELDASVDGTSALHYGANDPALYEEVALKPD